MPAGIHKSYFRSLFTLLSGLPGSTRTIIQTVIYSIAAALAAVGFLLLTNHTFEWSFGYFATQSKTFFLIASFITIMGSSLAVGILLNLLSPDAAGSGIPQIKAAYWKEIGYVPFKPVIMKFIAGVISIGGGSSLGREGPTVFIGGGLASVLSGFLGVPKRLRRGAVVIGASAGLAAAFNTPLAAITFVLEEIVGDISSRSIGRVVISSVIGAFVVYAIIGKQPAFSLPNIDQVSWIHYVAVPLVALIASLIGVVFQRYTLYWRKRFKKVRVIPPWLLPCLGGLITWVLGVSCYLSTGKLGVFSLGYHDLSQVLHNDFIWWVAGILVVAKLIATIASYACGGCGGIFSPMLFLGGLCGYFLAGVIGLWVDLTPSDTLVLACVGMSSCLGTVVKAPLSSLLIVFEMTHQFSLVPGLLIGMFISMLTSRLAGVYNFYDALLLQDGHELLKIRPPQDLQSWQNLAISSIANPNPVVAASLERHELQRLLSNYPYNDFPLVKDGVIQGVLQREEVLEALSEDRDPEMVSVVTCYPDQTVRDVADKFLDSPSGIIVIVTRGNQEITGIITLHDLLRAQAAILD